MEEARWKMYTLWWMYILQQLNTNIVELCPELHHIIPISLGGSKSNIKNMELIHYECHKMIHKAAE
jgi:5-methylcytosine-specific restriction endonuclease McrA